MAYLRGGAYESVAGGGGVAPRRHAGRVPGQESTLKVAQEATHAG